LCRGDNTLASFANSLVVQIPFFAQFVKETPFLLKRYPGIDVIDPDLVRLR
jgi:hypothetical protein